MKFSYLNYIPKLINSNVFEPLELSILKKIESLELSELFQEIETYRLHIKFTEKEISRLCGLISGFTASEIARNEGISHAALKRLHRKVEVMKEMLFLYHMSSIYSETKSFDLNKFHYYFTKSIIPTKRGLKHLRLSFNNSESSPEWTAGINPKYPGLKKGVSLANCSYKNPYLLAKDIYLAVEENIGPLSLHQNS